MTRRTLKTPCGRFVGAVLAALTVVAGGSLGRAADAQPDRVVEFNRDIRPILSDLCFQCHGPDQAQRKADLRLDTEAGAFADLGGHHALVAGKLDESELYARIASQDPNERMPPPKSGKSLTPGQIETVRLWIEQGAKWQKHWSLIAPQRPAVPAVQRQDWGRNDIDRFILARLEREGLSPAAEADKTTLIRRLTLDLTGLPPTPAEVDAFLADQTGDAYERVVDRLLTSPRYGERMATRWLDAARYADTNGYQSDGERFMWRWRDWVIEAFNNNLPFDRFTIEQLAGDLLPQPTVEQRIATGFNRNHRGNAEGGIIPEEYAVEYVVDRVDTTSTVWMGLTLGCTRCHDHKFDPLSQKEFYQLYAFFNNVPEKGRAIKYGNSPPMIPAPTREQQEQIAAVDAKLIATEQELKRLAPELAASQIAWEQTLVGGAPRDWAVTQGLQAHFPLDGDVLNRQPVPAAAPPSKGPPALVGATANTPATGATAEAPANSFKDGDPAYAAGRFGQAAQLDGTRFIEAGNVGDVGFYDKFSFSLWMKPEGDQGGVVLSRMKDMPRGGGWHLAMEQGKLQVNLVVRWLDDSTRVETEEPIPSGDWHHVLVTYDGSRAASAIRIYVDGRPVRIRVLLDDLNQTFKSTEPLRIGGGGGPEARFAGAIDDVRVYGDALNADQASSLAVVETISEIAAIPAEKRTPAQAGKLRACYLEQFAPEQIRTANQRLSELRKEREQLFETIPTSMVMEEMPTPRETFLLVRGEYDKPGEKVERGVPASLSPFPANAPNDRLGFARWLVDPAHPLTARVAVNRYWQMYFGTGLVKTVDDFGSQGEWPSHPDLLDWLATEFIRTGWNVKELQKLIVMSATYRQSSKVTPALLQKDPENRLLARGPRVRLSAEMIRDGALAASGLLVEKIGGPSVMPYQPEGLWKDLTGLDSVQDHGDKLYRRSMYTFWKRTVAPPSMMTFDASGRETCSVRETRTNTPLQALTLLNEVTFVEAARKLAERVLHDGGATPAERLTLAFRLATARRPTENELRILTAGLERHLALYRSQRAAAEEVVKIGEAPRDEKLDVSELAAYTAVAGLILNLDETITKE